MQVYIYVLFAIFLGRVNTYQDIILQCKLLLNGLEILNPDVQRLILSTRSRKYAMLLGEPRRKMDAYSHLKMLVQQGAIMCEISKLDAIFRCTNTEDMLKIKDQVCHFPVFSPQSSAENTDMEVMATTNEIKSKHNLCQFIRNSSPYYNLPPLQELQMPTTTTMLDILEILEEWVNKLSLLIPIYPVIKGYDTNSEGSDSGSSKSLHRSVELARTSLGRHAMDELMKTENQHMIAVAKDEYGHSTMQSRLIENESKQCKSGKDFINLYNKAGMKNTEQYFEITNRILSLKNDVLKNHPKIMALNRRDRNKL
ncbi:MAG: hypothetical protein EOP45_11945, partial [Sphingobacteriaceae bacterium]